MGNSFSVVCDLDGVLFRGAEPIPGAGEALRRLESMGCQLLYATNNSTRTAAEVATTITQRTGHAVQSGEVVTSGMATAHHLRPGVATAFVIGGPGLAPTLQEAGIVVVDGVEASVDAVVMGLDRDISYEKLATATLAVRAGARLVATNADPTFPSPRGLVPGAGSIVAAVEKATGREAEVCGKPHEPMAHLVTELAMHDDIVMIGDRIETDIRFGIANGWRTVLVLTGVATAAEGAVSGADDVVSSIAEIPALLEAHAV